MSPEETRSLLIGDAAPVFAGLRWRRLGAGVRRLGAAALDQGSIMNPARRLDALAEAHSATGDHRYLEAAVDMVLKGGVEEPPALGAYRIGYLVRAAARDAEIGDGRVLELLGAADRLADQLGGSGTGIPAVEAACAGLALAVHLGELAVADRAALEAALLQSIEAELAGDGVHRSGSPGVHLELLGRLAAVLDSGLTRDRRLRTRRLEMEEAAAWMVAPDGSVAPVGDTTPRAVGGVWAGLGTGPRLMGAIYEHPALLHAATAGAAGVAPPGGWRVFPESGLAIAKSRWPQSPEETGASGYLVLQGVPRHRLQSDGLNLVWFEKGRWLLTEAGSPRLAGQHLRPDQWLPEDGASIDAGREGYGGGEEDGEGEEVFPRGLEEEQDHEEQPLPPDELADYARSARAHNVVAVDGADPADVGGEGLVRWGEIRGMPVADAVISLGDLTHRRSILLRPGGWLLLVDAVGDVSSLGSGGRRRRLRGDAAEATVWFHAGRGLDVFPGRDRVVIAAGGDPLAWVTQLAAGWIPVDPERGRSDPPSQGWCVGPRFQAVPIWAFGWRAPVPAISVTLVTLDAPPGDIGADGSGYHWVWGGQRVRVRLDRLGIADATVEPGASR